MDSENSRFWWNVGVAISEVQSSMLEWLRILYWSYPGVSSENNTLIPADLIEFLVTFISAGMYYIDPNQGSSADALLAYCSFSSSSKQTCLHPQHSQV